MSPMCWQVPEPLYAGGLEADVGFEAASHGAVDDDLLLLLQQLDQLLLGADVLADASVCTVEESDNGSLFGARRQEGFMAQNFKISFSLEESDVEYFRKLFREARKAAAGQDTGEIIETYTESRELFQNKAIACVAYAKEEAATLAGAKAMLKDMASRVEAREKRLERFETYIAECMKATGITEVKHELGLFSAKLYLERDESVEIDPDADFPAALCNDPKPPTPSKTKIKAAINAGEAVAGAQIVRKDRLTIS